MIISAEAVSEAHPDKLADKISDAVLDAILEKDKQARVACETFIANGFCVVGGKIDTSSYVPITDIVRQTIKESGYTNAEFGFDYRSAGVLVAIAENKTQELKNVASDSTIVYGYATDESPSLLPTASVLANKLALEISNARKSGLIPFLYPDSKVQVGILYENFVPKAINNIVIVSQHSPATDLELLKEAIIQEIVMPNLNLDLQKNAKILVNPTGMFVLGGPRIDTGLTSRKISSDTYGGAAPTNPSGISGKDPSMPDRSATYLARHIAKTIVAAKLAKRVLIELAYSIGSNEPLSFSLNTFSTSKFTDTDLTKAVLEVFDLSVTGAIKSLDLLRPIYKDICTFGHFTNQNSSWEQTNKAQDLQKALKI